MRFEADDERASISSSKSSCNLLSIVLFLILFCTNIFVFTRHKFPKGSTWVESIISAYNKTNSALLQFEIHKRSVISLRNDKQNSIVNPPVFVFKFFLQLVTYVTKDALMSCRKKRILPTLRNQVFQLSVWWTQIYVFVVSCIAPTVDMNWNSLYWTVQIARYTSERYFIIY
jgi:hypothetical protein